jgi:hypothetical protein
MQRQTKRHRSSADCLPLQTEHEELQRICILSGLVNKNIIYCSWLSKRDTLGEKGKIKQSHYRLAQALRDPGG